MYPYLLYITPLPSVNLHCQHLLPARHVNIREAADKKYLKNVERMKTQYAKRKQHQCNTTHGAEDTVTVRVPKNERSSANMPRLLCYVNEVRHDLYQLE